MEECEGMFYLRRSATKTQRHKVSRREPLAKLCAFVSLWQKKKAGTRPGLLLKGLYIISIIEERLPRFCLMVIIQQIK